MAHGVLPQACAASFSCRSSDATDACAPPTKILQGETLEPNQTCLSEKWVPQKFQFLLPLHVFSHFFCCLRLFAVSEIPLIFREKKNLLC